MKRKIKDQVDIDFKAIPRRVAQIERMTTPAALPPHLKVGLERYARLYLALNSSTPSQPSGAPSSISW